MQSIEFFRIWTLGGLLLLSLLAGGCFSDRWHRGYSSNDNAIREDDRSREGGYSAYRDGGYNANRDPYAHGDSDRSPYDDSHGYYGGPHY